LAVTRLSLLIALFSFRVERFDKKNAKSVAIAAPEKKEIKPTICGSNYCSFVGSRISPVWSPTRAL
jgi:hypothetical protein